MRTMTNAAITSASSSWSSSRGTMETTWGKTMIPASTAARLWSSPPAARVVRTWSHLVSSSSSSSSSSLRVGGGRIYHYDYGDDANAAAGRRAGPPPPRPSHPRQRQQRRHFARDRGGRRGRLPRGGGGGTRALAGNDDGDVGGRRRSSRHDERFHDFDRDDRDDRVVYRRFDAREDDYDCGIDDDRLGGGRRNVLIVGSSGVLGRALASHFSGGSRWNVVGADVTTNDIDVDDGEKVGDDGSGGRLLTEYVRLPMGGSLSDLSGALHRGVSAYVRGGGGVGKTSSSYSSSSSLLDAVVIAAGGWAGDVPVADYDDDKDDDGAKQAMRSAEVCERMIRMNYFPVVAGSLVGLRFMKRGGTF